MFIWYIHFKGYVKDTEAACLSRSLPRYLIFSARGDRDPLARISSVGHCKVMGYNIQEKMVTLRLGWYFSIGYLDDIDGALAKL